jgi:hypothetical protein
MVRDCASHNLGIFQTINGRTVRVLPGVVAHTMSGPRYGSAVNPSSRTLFFGPFVYSARESRQPAHTLVPYV